MAQVPIATVTTLAQMMAEIRERTNTVSQEESELYDVPLVNLCHDAILLVKSKQDPKQMARFYATDVTVTESSNLVDISTLDIASADPKDLMYLDTANGVALMITAAAFQNLKVIYSATDMAYMFIAYIASQGTTDPKFQIKTFRGSALVSPGTLSLVYLRNPAKQTTKTGKLDATEEMIREAIELVVQWVPDRLKGAA
jgi:hypothetical protein